MFIGDQAGAVIKRTSAHFPYDSPDHSEPCLRVESEVVTAAYLQELQAAVAPAGIHVLLIRLNDLTYAPEIAPAMLMRQQALALVDARKTIVEGAVKELQRYLGSTAEVEAQKILEFFVSNDSQSCAERAAALARPFINIHSHRDFQNLLARLDPQKQVAKFLKSALADYEQHASLR